MAGGIRARELEKTERGARHVAVELSCTQVPMSVVVHTLLDGTAVMKRWLEITNRSAHPIALTSAFPWTGRLWGDGPRKLVLGYTRSAEWGFEGDFVWKGLSQGANVIHQEVGLGYAHPCFLLRDEAKGDYFFGELEWPVNRIMEFDNNETGVSFKFGPTASNALRAIDAGETITTPAIHLGHIAGDFDSAVQAMHDHIRRSVLTPRDPSRAYRIECDFPEDQPVSVYRGKNYNETNIKKFMEVAADLGIELFILDGPTWCANYGEWQKTQPEEFPNGLKPLVDFAHQHNMLFGLYAEPEGGRDGYTSATTNEGKPGLTIGPWKDSRIFQQHPDWFLEPMILNLASSDAATYMENALTQIVEHHGIDIYRHDYNRELEGEGPVTERHGFVESNYWRYYEAFHRDFAQLHEKFPNLILQQASGGGSRLDLATVANCPENYTSDQADLPWVYHIVDGVTVYIPPEALVTPFGMWDSLPFCPTGPRPDLDTTLRSIYCLGCTPFIIDSLMPKSRTDLTPQVRDKFLHYAKIYRDFVRPIMMKSKVYHHAPINASGGVWSGNWFAMEFAAPDHSKGWATVIRLIKDASDSYLLKPRGLDPRRQYAVTIDTTGATEIRSGAEIANTGLRIQPKEGTYSELVLFTAQQSR